MLQNLDAAIAARTMDALPPHIGDSYCLQRADRPEQCSRPPDGCFDAVSYTHLTLPTICSV
eukprot:6267282-Alexandrium_andersonii.AAC.1